MKRFLSISALLLVAFAFSAFAQDKHPDFSGKWVLDKSKSKLSDRMPIESMTLTAAQTETELTTTWDVKRGAPPEGEKRPEGGMRPDGGGRPEGGPPEGGRGGMGGGGGRMGGGMGGPQNGKFTLDGKEVKTTVDGMMGPVQSSTKAKFDGSNLKITMARSFTTQMGEMTMTTTEKWSLSADGNTLTIKRDSETPRGTQSTEMVFTKEVAAKQ